MNGELVGVIRSPSNAVAPCAAAVDRGHERTRLDCHPESFRLEWMACDPSNVMGFRSRWEGPFRRGGQLRQVAGLLPGMAGILRPPDLARLGACPHEVRLRGARSDGHDQSSGETDRLPGSPAIIAPEDAAAVGATPCSAVNQLVGRQTRGVAADPARECGGTALNVNGQDLTIGRD